MKSGTNEVRENPLATITSQFVSACIMVSYFMKKSNIMRLSRTALRPNMKLCLEIVKLGISAGITQFAAFIMQTVMNNTLQYYGNQSGITGGVALGAMGIDGVLYAGLIADISSGVIIAIFIVPEMRKLRGGKILKISIFLINGIFNKVVAIYF